MIRAISYQQFGIFLLTALSIYYFGFGLAYYRKKIIKKLVKPKENQDLFSGLSEGAELKESKELPPEEATTTVGSTKANEIEKRSIQEPDLYPVANELVESLDDFIVTAGKKGHIKEEVLFGIRVLIAKYPVLHRTGFKAAISNYVGIALKDNCAFEVNEQEMASLWAK